MSEEMYEQEEIRVFTDKEEGLDIRLEASRDDEQVVIVLRTEGNDPGEVILLKPRQARSLSEWLGQLARELDPPKSQFNISGGTITTPALIASKIEGASVYGRPLS